MKEKKLIQKRKKKFLVFAVMLSLLCIPAILTPVVEAATDYWTVQEGEEYFPGDEIVLDRSGYGNHTAMPVEYYDAEGNQYNDLTGTSSYDATTHISKTVLPTKTGVLKWKVDYKSLSGGEEHLRFVAVPGKHTIIYKNGTVELQNTQVNYGGATPAYQGATPTKASDVQYEYTFLGWSPAVAATVTANATYDAQFTKSLRKYPITWQDDEGNELDVTKVAYGEVPTHADPTKAATDEYTYTFKGWDADPVAVTGPATYKAVFEAIPVSKQAEVKTTAATTTTEAKDNSAPTGDTAPLAAAGALALASLFGAAALLLKKKA